ncbi:hypothetical protein IJV79_03875 [bacterium]|nr:hypothetical protein [bacterium]
MGIKGNLVTPSLMFSREETDNFVYNIGIKNLKLKGRNYSQLDNPRIINNYLFENIGDFQNVSPIIWGACEGVRNSGVIPV